VRGACLSSSRVPFESCTPRGCRGHVGTLCRSQGDVVNISVGITGDTYGHVGPRVSREAADRLHEALQAARTRRKLGAS
jgi:hypothetical protein